jgi:hypothetical protein
MPRSASGATVTVRLPAMAGEKSTWHEERAGPYHCIFYLSEPHARRYGVAIGESISLQCNPFLRDGL